jgi:predicted ATPase
LETDFPEGAICFAALASINDPALVLPAVAVALGIEERVRDADDRAPDADAVLEAVRNQLAGDRVLLVLDNFEHLLPAAAVVNELLAAAPGLKVLATSRSLLRVRGEHEIPVHPFELPFTDGPIDLDTIAAAPAVALFVASAAGVRPGFALTDENASAVAEICRRLDGLPLAIELAAARMRLLSPQAVALRLDNRLELLTGGARDVHSRHQTLRGTIDWSYELLDPAAQTTLARVAVFIGGFSLEAAERVCAAEELERDAIVGALLSLADENLLRRREGTDGEVRFELLETIREYALFRLIERREVEEFRRRHAAFCVELAETAEPNLVGPKQAAWVSLLDDDSGNMRAALAWSLDGGTLEPGLRIAGALFRYWSIRGQLSEARRWLDQALGTSPDVSPEVLADALFAAAYTALGQGDFREAFERFEQSLEISRSRADAARSAKCLTQLAWLLTVRGELDDGTTLAEASLELARELGDDRTASLALSVLGDAAYASEEYERAAAFYADALALRRELGDVRIVADSLLKAGRTDLLLGNRPSAIALLEEGLAAAKELGDGWTTSVALAGLAFAALDARDADRAASLLGEALAFAGQRGDKRVAAECLTAAGATVALRGDETGAIQLAAAAECLRESISAAVSPLERRVVEMHVDRETTDLDSVEAAARAGRRLDFAAAIAFAVDRIRPAPGSP